MDLEWNILSASQGVYTVYSAHLGNKEGNVKGMVQLTQDMASYDDFGPPEYSDDGQSVILCKKHADFTLF